MIHPRLCLRKQRMLLKRVRAVTALEMIPWELCADDNSLQKGYLYWYLLDLFSLALTALAQRYSKTLGTRLRLCCSGTVWSPQAGTAIPICPVLTVGTHGKQEVTVMVTVGELHWCLSTSENSRCESPSTELPTPGAEDVHCFYSCIVII